MAWYCMASTIPTIPCYFHAIPCYFLKTKYRAICYTHLITIQANAEFDKICRTNFIEQTFA
jgi:hypothetical protein